MRIKLFLVVTLTILLTNCAAKISSNFSSQEKPLTINDKVVFLDTHHKLPENVKKLGEAKFGDSGFSTDCSFNSNLIKAREIARKNGANIVKVVENKAPDLWSTCNRMKIEFYYSNENVSELNQYKLQID